MTSSIVDGMLQVETTVEPDDKLEGHYDIVDGYDHRKCSLQLIDWKTENLLTTENKLDARPGENYPTWKTIDTASRIVIG